MHLLQKNFWKIFEPNLLKRKAESILKNNCRIFLVMVVFYENFILLGILYLYRCISNSISFVIKKHLFYAANIYFLI